MQNCFVSISLTALGNFCQNLTQKASCARKIGQSVKAWINIWVASSYWSGFCVTMHLLYSFPNSWLCFLKSFLITLHTIKLLHWTNHVHKFALLIVQNTVLQEPSVLYGSCTVLQDNKMIYSNGWPIYDGKTNLISITALIRMTHENWNFCFSIGQKTMENYYYSLYRLLLSVIWWYK